MTNQHDGRSAIQKVAQNEVITAFARITTLLVSAFGLPLLLISISWIYGTLSEQTKVLAVLAERVDAIKKENIASSAMERELRDRDLKLRDQRFDNMAEQLKGIQNRLDRVEMLKNGGAR